jgi:hypothetical protein
VGAHGRQLTRLHSPSHLLHLVESVEGAVSLGGVQVFHELAQGVTSITGCLKSLSVQVQLECSHLW